MSFEDLGLSPEVLKAVTEAGYSTPTPIQEQAVPYVLMGRDVLGCAQTGTGKTASFTLPMIDILASGRARARMPRSLIIEPTRELAAQVSESFEKYGKYNKLSMALLIGGESFVDQEKKLDRGVDVLIATPGRLIDLFERGKILLADTKILVIDEADRMLDMGFIPDVERIVGLLPKIRQTLFFSATMPPEIRRLADAFLMNPKEVSVAPPASPAAALVEQAMVRVSGLAAAKRERLRELIVSEAATSALIFCNRKRDVTIVYRSLKRHGYSVAELHGDLPQPSRMATLKAFKDGEVRLLVCSDVAARGLDIPKVSHVFNYDVPINAEDYVHRIGRTGRAGRSGKSFTLVTASDRKYLAAITKLIGSQIHEVVDEGGAAPAAAEEAEARVAAEAPAERRRRRPRRERSGEKREAATRESVAGEPVGNEQGEQVSDLPEPAPQDEVPQEAAPREAASRPSGRRESGRRGAGRRERAPRQDEPAEIDEEALAAGDSVPSKPFGDHTPAFILRPVKIAVTA